MKVYIVFASDAYTWDDAYYLEEVFFTKEKAEQYIKNIENDPDKEQYDYWIMERDVC